MRTRFPLSLLLAGALAGCVTGGPFPSLAQREGETLPIEEPVRTPAAVADDAALHARIEALVAQARHGMDAFDAAYGPAGRAAAGSAPEGSDRWIAAQQAISRLEAARAETTEAAAELDRLSQARADAPTSTADRDALAQAIAEAERIAANQQDRLNRLRGVSGN
jgi:hypothetical protein